MRFPLVPLPPFLLKWYPQFQEWHAASAEIFGILFAFLGFLIILLSSGSYPDEGHLFGTTVKDRTQTGLVFLGIAISFCIFGLYLSVLFVTVLCAFLLGILIFLIKLVFSRKASRTH